MQIDLDRGATQRKHPGGFFVSMYKDDPGIYYGEDGAVCDVALAEGAGFPVQAHYKERRRRELMAKYKVKIDRMMTQEMASVDKEIEKELAAMDGGATEAPAPAPAPEEAAAEEPGARRGRK